MAELDFGISRGLSNAMLEPEDTRGNLIHIRDLNLNPQVGINHRFDRKLMGRFSELQFNSDWFSCIGKCISSFKFSL